MSKIYLKNVGDIKVGKKYKNDHYPLTTYLGCGMRPSIFSSIMVNKCLVIIEDAGNETVNDDGVTPYIGNIWASDNFEDFYLFEKNKPIKRNKVRYTTKIGMHGVYLLRYINGLREVWAGNGWTRTLRRRRPNEKDISLEDAMKEFPAAFLN